MDKPLPCPKCGNKTWDGPRYVRALYKGEIGPAALGYDDWLSYTCTDCQFVRYEAPLDRKALLPPMVFNEQEKATMQRAAQIRAEIEGRM